MAGGLGITATRNGLTKSQRIIFAVQLRLLLTGPFVIDHGDCIGGDEECHNTAIKIPRMFVRIHPPDNDKLRAFCKHTNMWMAQPKPYLERNKDIVNNTNALVALPGEFQEQKRSGTWSTIRYGIKQGKNVHIIFPDGSMRIHTSKFVVEYDRPSSLKRIDK